MPVTMPDELTIALDVSELPHNPPPQTLVSESLLPTHTESLPPKIGHCALALLTLNKIRNTHKTLIKLLNKLISIDRKLK
jgi:hypothetical protein